MEMTDDLKASGQHKRGSYKPLYWLIALCAFPYIAGTLWYQYRDVLPAGDTTNYGQLVEPVREIANVELTLADGSHKALADFHKKWLMLYILDGQCTEDCLKNVYYMRQIRKAMAQDRFRIRRLMIVEQASLQSEDMQRLAAKYPDLFVVTLSPEQRQRLNASLQGGPADNIYRKIMLIDPLGNYMMHYPQEPEPEKVLKDIKRLLKVSRVG